MAVQYWQQRRPEAGPKNQFLHFKLAYHGDTIGAVSVGQHRAVSCAIQTLAVSDARRRILPIVIAVRWR